MAKASKDLLEQELEQTTSEDIKKESQEDLERRMEENILKRLGIDSLKKQDAKKEIVNELVEVPQKPRRIIFEIKGSSAEDSMYDGKYIPGRAMGLSGNKLISRPINRNNTTHKDNANYITGLNVDEIAADPNLTEDVKNQRISDVQVARKWLEWKYKTSLASNNFKFWDDYKIILDDLSAVYDTHKITGDKKEDPILMYFGILGGAHPDIAPSFEELGSRVYYMTVREEEVQRNFKSQKDKIKANAALNDIMSNWSKQEVLYLLNYLENKELGFTLNTPEDLLIQQLSDFIDGEDVKQDKKKQAGIFLDAVALMKAEPDVVKARALFNCALYYGFIITNAQKDFVNRITDFNYGGSIQEGVRKMLDPRYAEERTFVQKKVLDKWKI